MSDQSSLTLTTLEAIQLFRVKQPADWTAEEFTAFRDWLEQNSSLIATLGGQHEVDRRLAEVAKAQATASRQPAVHDASAATVASLPPAARSKVLGHMVAATLFLALLAGAGGLFYSVWPKAEPDETTTADASVLVAFAIRFSVSVIEPSLLDSLNVRSGRALDWALLSQTSPGLFISRRVLAHGSNEFERYPVKTGRPPRRVCT